MKPTAVLAPAVRAAKHPLETAAYGVGLLRGAAAAVLRVASGERGPLLPGHLPGPVAAPMEENVPPEDVVHMDLIDAAPQREPAPPGEAFVTEPSAVTRNSAHGGRGNDAEIDDWYGDVEPDDGPDGVVEALQAADGVGPLVDQAAISKVLSEAAARRQPERGEG